MRRFFVAAVLLSCAGQQQPMPEPPEKAARLAVARCAESMELTAADYTQALKPIGQLSLFAEPALQGALGGLSETAVLYGRKVDDGVWAILVTDHDKRVCEAFISAEIVEVVTNDPGPEPTP